MNITRLHIALLVLSGSLAGLLCGPASAQDAWSLLGPDLSTAPVSLKAIDAAGVRVAPTAGGPERVIPFDQFVELTRTLAAAPPHGKYDLRMVSGDHINGEPIAVKGESLAWKNAVAGEVIVPLRQLASLTAAGATLADEKRAQDVVTFSNGDTVRGTVTELNLAKVTVSTDSGLTDLPFESVRAIGFATTATPAGQADKAAFRVRIDEGSSVIGSAVTLDKGGLSVTLSGERRVIDIARVTGIEQINGPVSWLSSRTPTQSIYVPYVGNGQDFPARMNRNYKGEPIFFKDRRYERGIGVHSYSKLVFRLDGSSYTTFRARYALDPDSSIGDVTVRIKLDDRIVHEKEHFRSGVLSPPVVVDLNGATSLTLEVDFGSGGNAQDRLNWIEPALLKVRPASEPSTAPAAGR